MPSKLLRSYLLFSQVQRDHEADKMFDVWDLLENPRHLRSLNSLEVIKEWIGQDINYVFQDGKEKYVYERPTFIHAKPILETEVTPKTRIQIMKLDEPRNNK